MQPTNTNHWQKTNNHNWTESFQHPSTDNKPWPCLCCTCWYITIGDWFEDELDLPNDSSPTCLSKFPLERAVTDDPASLGEAATGESRSLTLRLMCHRTPCEARRDAVFLRRSRKDAASPPNVGDWKPPPETGILYMDGMRIKVDVKEKWMILLDIE